ncbi:MAG: 2-amino-4-hydroxy-6-hydroxymethyldihydropteridine diphosphokinase [Motiliproteus sp.]|nr:2-amino-4-hydroxy-6-hydroxymethyldihydropteridine diphosphokinase [Motiliproteus sp.]MCW9052054.1 2-amino-4-hydroxy-6-hydroxymethyldihydropteridine diphosphokinase [Motiliproteus sp.]
MTAITFIGLGSNLANPIDQVQRAFEELAQLPNSQLLKRSSLYRSDPVGPADQPDFINAAATLSTEFTPLQLLDQLQSIEQLHQRERIEHWGPRTLDLDLLLYDQQVIDHPRLKVPHPYLEERAFVLYPLAEIAPELQLPDNQTLSELLATCPMGTLQQLAL